MTEFNGSERTTATPIPDTWEEFRVALQGIYHAHDPAPTIARYEDPAKPNDNPLGSFLDSAYDEETASEGDEQQRMNL